MKDWWPRIVILALLVVVVGVPFVVRPEQASAPAAVTSGDEDLVLIIMSPHNEQIRYELERAFNAWRK